MDLSTGFMTAQKGSNGVLLLGEALGQDEAEQGKPFVGKAGFKLSRIIQWAGFKREDFSIANTVWCRPPENKLEGTHYELPAIAHCRSQHWGGLLAKHRVVVPLGNVPTNALIGQKGILGIRGYVSSGMGYHVIPTVHPSYIARGQSKWTAPLINDLQKAVFLSENGMPPQITDYTLDPSPMRAYQWALEYREALKRNPTLKCAFDIETPMKGDEEDEVDTDSDAPDKSWHIERISFAYKSLHAISIVWSPEYFAAIRTVLESDGPKVVWNAGYDVPRIRRSGIKINGLIHDGMVAWHILHSDLPKSLRFVATFTCPWQPAWKHLSGARPAFYSATDSDVEWRSMERIEEELKKTDLWNVYQRDVLDLDPILIHMQSHGMPVDREIRLDRAIKLDKKLKETHSIMEACVPMEARRIDRIYKNTPKVTEGLSSRPSTRQIRTCAQCGLERPGKPHFRRFKKKSNPCADAGFKETTQRVVEFYRVSEFKPSREQLVRYHQIIDRPLPTVWDKKEHKRKISFGEEQLKDLQLKYPSDPLYPSILEYRSIDKLAGTYIGRVEE